MSKKIIEIEGMHCNSCERVIEEALKDNVKDIKVSYAKGIAEIEYDPEEISSKDIKEIIKKQGYEIKGEDQDIPKNLIKEEITNRSDQVGWWVLIGIVAFIAFAIYYLFLRGIDVSIPGVGESGSLFLLFFVGILTGFHCVSMCGAFVVSYTTKNAMNGHKGFKQHLVYGGSKVISYALIGGIFGLIGGIFAFSFKLRGAIAIFAGIFMVFYALSMFGFKFFRRFQFNPRFLTKFTSKASKSAKGAYKGPFITGLLSGLFIACGPLQAMYLYAAGVGNFFQGFASLAAFGLGTLPVMIGFGSMATVISKKATKRILKISAIIVLILGLIILNRGLTLMGSPVSYDSIKTSIIGGDISGNAILLGDYQEIHMEINRYGWEPNSFVLKKGIPVKWLINVKELTGCNNEIVVPSYNINIKLEKGLNTVEFTPDKEGTIRWSCWMGMIPGNFIVTDTGEATQQQVASATPAAGGGSCGGSCGSPSCGSTGGGCGGGCGG